MDLIFEAGTKSAGQLIGGSTFIIPMYQREYAWKKAEYEALWTDLRDNIDEDYFLGLVILTKSGQQMEVVDGQQRLITLSLLAVALREQCRLVKRESLATEVESTFLLALDYDTEERFPRVRFSDPEDRRIFDAILEDPGSVASIDHEMVHAHAHFRRELAKDLADDAFQRVGAWARFLSEGLYFARFVHPDAAAAYTVFEVINDRGRQLSSADLLKNDLLSRAQPEEREAYYARWKHISSQFDDADAFVLYIRHVAMLSRGYILPKQLYRKVARSSDGSKGMLDLLPELEGNLPFYLQIADPSVGGPGSDDAAVAFSGFNAIGVMAVRPLLLALGPTSDDAIHEAFRLTGQIAAVTALGPANIERRFSEAALKAVAGEDWTQSLRPILPTREDFLAGLPRRRHRRPMLQLLLRAIHQQSPVPAAEGYIQLLRPPTVEDWVEFDDDEFELAGMTIGNAVLTQHQRRPRRAFTWETTKGSLVPDMLDGAELNDLIMRDEWTLQNVRERSARLAQEATDVWY